MDSFRDYDETVNVSEIQPVLDYLEDNYTDVGLNADFCFSAYKLTSDLYITDNEDGESVSVVQEVFTDDGRELEIVEDFYDLETLQTFINSL